MNFELGGHIVWDVELKKKKQNLQKFYKAYQRSNLQGKVQACSRQTSV